MSGAAFVEPMAAVTGRPIWNWPDDLEDALFIEWGLRQLDWTNGEFAAYLGLSRKQVSHWVNGRSPPKPWVRRILKLLILVRLNMEVMVG